MPVNSVHSTTSPLSQPAAGKPSLPSVKTLKNVLGTWEFHSPNHQLRWSRRGRPARC